MFLNFTILSSNPSKYPISLFSCIPKGILLILVKGRGEDNIRQCMDKIRLSDRKQLGERNQKEVRSLWEIDISTCLLHDILDLRFQFFISIVLLNYNDTLFFFLCVFRCNVLSSFLCYFHKYIKLGDIVVAI